MAVERRRPIPVPRPLRPEGFLIAAWLVLASTASAQPVFDGVEATVYATADNPFEIEFGPDGTLYAGHHSPPNGPARLLRVVLGSGAATEWGAETPEDPDGIDYFNGLVYASSEGPIWQANPGTGAMAVWGTVSGSPNQSTLVVDEAGDYAQAGSIFVGNARFGTDIHLVLPSGTVSAFTTSASLYIIRALQFVDGTLYFTEIGTTKGVWSVSSSGVPTQISDGGHAWNSPDGMVYEPDTDTFLVGDGDRLLRLPRSGGTVQEVGTDFGTISALTLDADGNLYVADLGDHVIWRIANSVPLPAMGAIARTLLAVALVAVSSLALRRPSIARGGLARSE